MSDENRLERIEDKVDKISDIQSKMQLDLAVHIEGVMQTRALIALQEQKIAQDLAIKEKKLESDLHPIIEHVKKVEGWFTIAKIFSIGIAKLIGYIAVSAGVIEGVVALLEYLRK